MKCVDCPLTLPCLAGRLGAFQLCVSCGNMIVYPPNPLCNRDTISYLRCEQRSTSLLMARAHTAGLEGDIRKIIARAGSLIIPDLILRNHFNCRIVAICPVCVTPAQLSKYKNDVTRWIEDLRKRVPKNLDEGALL